MTIEKTIIKNGLTRHETTTFVLAKRNSPDGPLQWQLSPEEEEEFERTNKENSVDAYLDRHEEWAREILSSAGLPGHMNVVRVRPNEQWSDDLPESWREMNQKEVFAPGERPAILIALVKNRFFTLEYYAAHVLRWADNTRRHIKNGLFD